MTNYGDKYTRILANLIDDMEGLANGAVNENGEERAFTAKEQASFDAMSKCAENLKELIEKLDQNKPNEAALLKAAFSRR